MGTYRISELARRSGFTSSTIRYYEQVGLMPSPSRSPSGYRLYDEDAVSRLAFVARAKRMGFTLESISELVSAWTDGECAPVHERLSALLTAKLDAVDMELASLTAFRRQLGDVSRRLEASVAARVEAGVVGRVEAGVAGAVAGGVAEPLPRRCGPGCGCDADLVEPASRAWTLSDCALSPDAIEARLQEWRALAGQASGWEAIAGGLRVAFSSAAAASQLAELCAREVECCSFFRFAIGMDGSGVWLDVQAPADAQEAVRMLFGVAA